MPDADRQNYKQTNRQTISVYYAKVLANYYIRLADQAENGVTSQ